MTEEFRLSIDVDGTPIPAIAARPDGADATVVVAHGAGAGMEHPFLAGFARALNAAGLATLRFDFPYRATGRRFPDRPPVAIATWRAAAAEAARLAADAGAADAPVWAAGKSFGGRMASMAVADGMPAAGLVYLGYPLHPPGKPDRVRDEHLYGLTTPMLFLQGANDPFAKPNDQLDAVVARIGPTAVLDWIEGGGHSFEVKGRTRPQDEIAAELAPRVVEFVRAHAP